MWVDWSGLDCNEWCGLTGVDWIVMSSVGLMEWAGLKESENMNSGVEERGAEHWAVW